MTDKQAVIVFVGFVIMVLSARGVFAILEDWHDMGPIILFCSFGIPGIMTLFLWFVL